MSMNFLTTPSRRKYQEKLDLTQNFLDQLQTPPSNNETRGNDTLSDVEDDHVDFGNIGFMVCDRSNESSNMNNTTSRQSNILRSLDDDRSDRQILNDQDVTPLNPPLNERIGKKRKSTNSVRRDIAKSFKPKTKSERAAKKQFKDNFLTLKNKIDSVQQKAGSEPNFALIMFDNVHRPDVRGAASHAGRYLVYTKGDISSRFFSETGIKFDPDEFFVCENGIDFKEDRKLPIEKALKRTRVEEPREIVNGLNESNTSLSDDNGNISEEADQQSDSDIEPNIFEMRQVAKRVSWGAPDHDSDVSTDASDGVHIYGRAAGKKVTDKRKNSKKEKQKRQKESASKSKTDILANQRKGAPKTKTKTRNPLPRKRRK